jgi:hypothetical protein
LTYAQPVPSCTQQFTTHRSAEGPSRACLGHIRYARVRLASAAAVERAEALQRCSASWLPSPQDTQHPGSMPPKRPLPSPAPRHDDRGAAAPEPEQGGGGGGQTIYATAPEGVMPEQTFRVVQTGSGEVVEVEFPPGVRQGEEVPFHLNETPSSHHTGHGGTGSQDVTGYEVRALSDPTLIMRAKCRVYLRSRRLHSCSTCSMSTEIASSARTNMKFTCSKLDQVETGTVYMVTAQASGITKAGRTQFGNLGVELFLAFLRKIS